MHWRFRAHAPYEELARSRMLARIDSWWRAFEANAPEILRVFHRQSRLDLAAWMHEHLGAVHPEIMWEYGPGLRGGHRLVMTAETKRYLRPMLAVLLERAPAIPGWEFYPYRLAEPIDDACATLEGRTGHSLEGFRACLAVADGGVDVTFWSPQVAAIGEEAARSIAFVASEALLGEEVLDKFVDTIEVAQRPSGQDVALTDLRAHVDTLLARDRERMSSTGLVDGVGSTPWTLLELKPRQAEDYPGQLDLFVAKTAHLSAWKRAHSNRPFASERYTAAGETFAYVKLDGSQGLDQELFADKREIEDALDAALLPARLGVHIGGGTGLRYSYVDLALTDVDRAIPIIRDVLRRGRIPKRSWIHFFDDTLADEWIPIWDDSPAPPMAPT